MTQQQILTNNCGLFNCRYMLPAPRKMRIFQSGVVEAVMRGVAFWRSKTAHLPCYGLFLAAAIISSLTVVASHALAAKKSIDNLDLAVAKLIGSIFEPKTCDANQKKSIGIWVFDEDKIPISAANAKRLHQELLARLLARRPTCVTVLDSEGIGVIVAHLQKTGALQKSGGSLVAALNDENQHVDFIVFPSLYNQGGKTVLALRAVERVSGRTIALTAPVPVPASYLVQDVSDDAVSLAAAINSASKYFAEEVPNLRELRPIGIFFEDTGAQPSAGRYLLDQLLAMLTKDASNVITGKVLRIRSLTIEPRPSADGLVDAKELEAGSNDNASYDLFGRYWLRGNSIDLRLTMKRRDGGAVAWRGKIRLSDLKGLDVRPENPAATLHSLPKGAFAFQLTSPKGENPIYRSGEELSLYLRLGQDAALYCFYVDSKGGVMTVLPNQFSRAGGQPTIFKAKTLLHLPDAARDNFKFRFTSDTSGIELVSCFASSRDVRSDLPDALFSSSNKTVPFLTLEEVRRLFASLQNTKISEATVTITVAK